MELTQIVYKTDDLYSIIQIDANNNAFEYVRVNKKEIVNRTYKYIENISTKPDKRLRELLNTNRAEIANERAKNLVHNPNVNG